MSMQKIKDNEWFFPVIYIVDKRILQSNWTRDTPAKITPKNGNLRCCLPLMTNSTYKTRRYQLILSRQIHDQRIL